MEVLVREMVVTEMEVPGMDGRMMERLEAAAIHLTMVEEEVGMTVQKLIRRQDRIVRRLFRRH